MAEYFQSQSSNNSAGSAWLNSRHPNLYLPLKSHPAPQAVGLRLEHAHLFRRATCVLIMFRSSPATSSATPCSVQKPAFLLPSSGGLDEFTLHYYGNFS
jgi:hypothetical protein